MKDKLQIEEDITQILRKHYKHPDRLELNEPYIILFQDLVDYVLKTTTAKENNK